MRGSRLVTTERVVCIAAPGTTEIVDTVRSAVADHGLAFASYEVGESIAEYRITGGDALGVVVGGDGTFLRAVKEFAPHEIPLLSVDAGTLGFLTVTPPDGIEAAFEEILRGRATITDHLQVQVNGDGVEGTGINEVQIDAAASRDEHRSCQLEVFVDEEYVGRYDGQGLLVNTPTGSTAMALSSGGPVHRGANNETLQITPLHTANTGVRPLVVDASVEITVVPATPVRASLDGARPEQTVTEGGRLTITGAETPVYLVRTSQSHSVMDAITAKLGWGVRGESGLEPPPSEPEAPSDFLDTAVHIASEAAFAAGTPVRQIYDHIDQSDSGVVSDELVGTAFSRSEQIIAAILGSEFPGHTVISEGWTVRGGTDRYTWVIDPLDGMGNFAHGNPSFTVAISLVEDTTPVVGVVYSPVTDDLFCGARGKGATRNGNLIEPTDRSALDESMLLSGYDPTGEFLKRFYRGARGVRRLGSASLHLCYVAASSADAHWEYDTYPWDVAAGLCILWEAGGKTTDADGDDYELRLDDTAAHAPLLASNGPLHDTLLDAFPDEGF